MANELACLNCGKGFIPTCHITRQKFCSSECRVRYNNAKRYCTDTPVNECPEYGTPIQQSGEAGRWHQCEKEEACVPMKKSTIPPALLPGSGIVSASLLAQIMNSKYVLALPLYRQEQELHRLGLPVSRQTMSNWVLTAGERWLLPVYHVLHKELLANEILHADETTLMVLREPERQARQTSWARTAFRSLHSGMPRHTRDAMTARSWMRTSRRSARTPTRAWTGCRKQRRRSYKKPPGGRRTRSRRQKKTAGPEARRRSTVWSDMGRMG